MTTTTTLVDGAALIAADSALMRAWLRGPASGDGSLVDFGGGVILKTPARLAAEASVFETVAALAIASNTIGVNLGAAGVFTLALTANVTTMNITGAQAGKATSFILELTADGTGRTFTEPGSVVAMDGAYTPTSTNTKKDRLLYETIDGGTTWRRWIVFQNV